MKKLFYSMTLFAITTTLVVLPFMTTSSSSVKSVTPTTTSQEEVNTTITGEGDLFDNGSVYRLQESSSFYSVIFSSAPQWPSGTSTIEVIVGSMFLQGEYGETTPITVGNQWIFNGQITEISSLPSLPDASLASATGGSDKYNPYTYTFLETGTQVILGAKVSWNANANRYYDYTLKGTIGGFDLVTYTPTLTLGGTTGSQLTLTYQYTKPVATLNNSEDASTNVLASDWIAMYPYELVDLTTGWTISDTKELNSSIITTSSTRVTTSMTEVDGINSGHDYSLKIVRDTVDPTKDILLNSTDSSTNPFGEIQNFALTSGTLGANGASFQFTWTGKNLQTVYYEVYNKTQLDANGKPIAGQTPINSGNVMAQGNNYVNKFSVSNLDYYNEYKIFVHYNGGESLGQNSTYEISFKTDQPLFIDPVNGWRALNDHQVEFTYEWTDGLSNTYSNTIYYSYSNADGTDTGSGTIEPTASTGKHTVDGLKQETLYQFQFSPYQNWSITDEPYTPETPEFDTKHKNYKGIVINDVKTITTNTITDVTFQTGLYNGSFTYTSTTMQSEPEEYKIVELDANDPTNVSKEKLVLDWTDFTEVGGTATINMTNLQPGKKYKVYFTEDLNRSVAVSHEFTTDYGITATQAIVPNSYFNSTDLKYSWDSEDVSANAKFYYQITNTANNQKVTLSDGKTYGSRTPGTDDAITGATPDILFNLLTDEFDSFTEYTLVENTTYKMEFTMYADVNGVPDFSSAYYQKNYLPKAITFTTSLINPTVSNVQLVSKTTDTVTISYDSTYTLGANDPGKVHYRIYEKGTTAPAFNQNVYFNETTLGTETRTFNNSADPYANSYMLKPGTTYYFSWSENYGRSEFGKIEFTTNSVIGNFSIDSTATSDTTFIVNFTPNVDSVELANNRVGLEYSVSGSNVWTNAYYYESFSGGVPQSPLTVSGLSYNTSYNARLSFQTPNELTQTYYSNILSTKTKYNGMYNVQITNIENNDITIQYSYDGTWDSSGNKLVDASTQPVYVSLYEAGNTSTPITPATQFIPQVGTHTIKLSEIFSGLKLEPETKYVLDFANFASDNTIVYDVPLLEFSTLSQIRSTEVVGKTSTSLSVQYDWDSEINSNTEIKPYYSFDSGSTWVEITPEMVDTSDPKTEGNNVITFVDLTSYTEYEIMFSSNQSAGSSWDSSKIHSVIDFTLINTGDMPSVLTIVLISALTTLFIGIIIKIVYSINKPKTISNRLKSTIDTTGTNIKF